jgi:hypothetical protein
MLKIHWTVFSLFLFSMTSWAQTELPIISAMDYVQIGYTIKVNSQTVSADNLKDALKDSEKVYFDINIDNGQSELLIDMLTLLIECDLPEENYSFKLSYSNPQWLPGPDETKNIFGESSSRHRYYTRIDVDGTPHYYIDNGNLAVDKVPDDQGIVFHFERQYQPADLLDIIKKIGPEKISSFGTYLDPPLIKVTPKLTPIGEAPPITLNSRKIQEGEAISIIGPYKPIKYDVEEMGSRTPPIAPSNSLRADLIEALNQEGLDNKRVKIVFRSYVFGNEIRLIGSCIFHQELDRTPVAIIDGETVYRYSATQTVIPICERLSPDNNTAQHTITLPNGEKYELEITAAVVEVDVRGFPIPAYEKSIPSAAEQKD